MKLEDILIEEEFKNTYTYSYKNTPQKEQIERIPIHSMQTRVGIFLFF
ncbi:hypothetical protein [Bacillus toyonensis]|nr:hypothetical protein [Bacillus toyonensis]HDR7478461.1 hypothetical protein [Bacillus toyonensis]